MTLSVAHEGKGKQKRGSNESPAKGRGDHGLRRLGAKLRALCQFVAGVGGKITDSDGKGKMLYLLKTSSNAFFLYSCTREAKCTFAFPNCLVLLKLA
jgi:hypothetical protein